jgi:hypothetical protein
MRNMMSVVGADPDLGGIGWWRGHRDVSRAGRSLWPEGPMPQRLSNSWERKEGLTCRASCSSSLQ